MAFVAVLKNNRTLVAIKDSWIKNPVLGECSLIYYSPKPDDDADFEKEIKYYFEKDSIACYDARIVAQFGSLELAKQHIDVRPRRYRYAEKTGFHQPTVVVDMNLSSDDESGARNTGNAAIVGTLDDGGGQHNDDASQVQSNIDEQSEVVGAIGQMHVSGNQRHDDGQNEQNNLVDGSASDTEESTEGAGTASSVDATVGGQQDIQFVYADEIEVASEVIIEDTVDERQNHHDDVQSHSNVGDRSDIVGLLNRMHVDGNDSDDNGDPLLG